MPPLDFQDLVLLSFIAWNHCVIVLFIFDLVYILNQILRSMLISSTHSLYIMTVSSWHLLCYTGLNCFLAIWAKQQFTGFLPKPASKESNVPKPKSSLKVILSNIYIVILPVSQHVFLLGFFLYACVFDTYQIFECGNQNYYKKLRTYFIFRIMGNYLSILSINSLQLFILRNDDLFIMRQNYKV